jgi:glutamyl-tRNA reductase
MILALSCGRDSPAELRARLALDEAAQRELLRAPREGVGELLVLCTCHRTEIYATTDSSSSDALHALAGLLPNLRPTDHHDLRFMEGLEAVEHLFRVACGLDSLVIGETQVLSQVRRAYVQAKREGAAGSVLSSVLDRAIALGRRVRAETSLGTLGQSVGTVAAEYLAARFGGLSERFGAIVGAGRAAGDTARALAGAGARLAVISRTPSSAASLAAEIGATPHSLEEIPGVFGRSDFAVVAITGGVLIRRDDVPARGETEPFVLLDLSVPPAVEVGGNNGIDMRTLEELPGPTGPEVTTAVGEAEAIVRSELAELERWFDTRAFGPEIRELRGRADALVRAEVARAIAGMDLSPEDRDRIGVLGMRIANKLLHGPTAALREADEETRALIRRVFGLES